MIRKQRGKQIEKQRPCAPHDNRWVRNGLETRTTQRQNNTVHCSVIGSGPEPQYWHVDAIRSDVRLVGETDGVRERKTDVAVGLPYRFAERSSFLYGKSETTNKTIRRLQCYSHR